MTAALRAQLHAIAWLATQAQTAADAGRYDEVLDSLTVIDLFIAQARDTIAVDALAQLDDDSPTVIGTDLAPMPTPDENPSRCPKCGGALEPGPRAGDFHACGDCHGGASS